MQSDRRRKPADAKALRSVRWTLISGRRYRVVLVLDPKLPRTRIVRAFSRALTSIIAGYNELWKDDNLLKTAEITRLRQSRKKWERTPARIAQVVGLPVWKVERTIYKKTTR